MTAVDWGTVPAWISAGVSTGTAAVAVVGAVYTLRRGRALLYNERAKLANGTIVVVNNGFIEVRNYTTDLIDRLQVYGGPAGAPRVQVEMKQDWVPPNGGVTVSAEQAAAHGFSPRDLSFQFRDARGTVWKRSWRATERLQHG